MAFCIFLCSTLYDHVLQSKFIKILVIFKSLLDFYLFLLAQYFISIIVVIRRKEMYKLLFSAFKYIILVSLVLFFCKVVQYETAQLFIRFRQQRIQRGYPNLTSSSQKQILRLLQDLTGFPVLGDMYLQQKALSLQNLKRYEQALTIVNKVIQSGINPQSFTLWYIKARSELTLKMYDKAEQSLIRASILVKQDSQDLILGQLYDKLSKSKIQQKKNKDSDTYSQEETIIWQQIQLS